MSISVTNDWLCINEQFYILWIYLWPFCNPKLIYS